MSQVQIPVAENFVWLVPSSAHYDWSSVASYMVLVVLRHWNADGKIYLKSAYNLCTKEFQNKQNLLVPPA